MASVFFNNYHEQLGKAGIDYGTDTFKLALMTTAYTPDVDTDAYRSDLTGEATGTGYTAGGQAVDTVTITQDNTNDRAVVDFDPEVFSTVTLSGVDGAVLYKDTGVASTDTLICYIDFTEGSQDVVANDFTVTPPVDGVLTIG